MATQSVSSTVPSTVSSTLSQKKLDANRRNALKSTGPKTPEGKAVASQNALRHGLRSRFCPILPGEDVDEFRAFHDAMVRDFKPCGIMQREIVDDLVGIRWKIRRIAHIETEMMAGHQSELQKKYDEKVSFLNGTRRKKEAEQEPRPNLDPIHLLAGIMPYNENNSFATMESYRERLQRGVFTLLRELRKLREETGEGEEEEGSAEDLGLRSEQMQVHAADERSQLSQCDTGLRPVRSDVQVEERVIADESSKHGPEAHVTGKRTDEAKLCAEAPRTIEATAGCKSLAGQEKRSADDVLRRAIDGALPQIARLDRMIETIAGMETRE